MMREFRHIGNFGSWRGEAGMSCLGERGVHYPNSWGSSMKTNPILLRDAEIRLIVGNSR
jgi:hypothetical protein